jgi:hypothetical protein
LFDVIEVISDWQWRLKVSDKSLLSLSSLYHLRFDCAPIVSASISTWVSKFGGSQVVTRHFHFEKGFFHRLSLVRKCGDSNIITFWEPVIGMIGRFKDRSVTHIVNHRSLMLQIIVSKGLFWSVSLRVGAISGSFQRNLIQPSQNWELPRRFRHFTGMSA